MVKAWGPNETLGKRLLKKNIEIFGFAGSCIQTKVLLEHLCQISIKEGKKTVVETLAKLSRHCCRDTC